MTDNVKSVRDDLQIRCMGLKSVGDQKKQGNLANKQPKRKIQKKNQEMNIQNSPPQADEDTTPFVANKVGSEEQPKNGSGSIIDLEI
ncbi:MAG TPA: hypothetical protein ACFYD6_01115 [Candidatus Brocadiia bacterium]|nr:hypothetical protein [Candidatus Brocadiales bacterium]